jgi:DNA glycosylase AlkZ-like
MLKLTWPQAAAWRIRRQHLHQRAPAGSLLKIASRLCGLHAQVMSCAELTVWARVEDLSRDAIQRSLWQDRTLVKTWAMRGTLHLLPSAELAMWHAALGASPRYLRESAWKKYFGITLQELDQITEAIATALDGRVMTREDLVQQVQQITGSAVFAANLAASSWGTVLKPAAFSGRLCFAPSIGQRVRFTRPDSWLAGQPPSSPVELQSATLEITRRFLAAYGPATHHDLARWWNGGGIATARQWIAALGDEVAQVEVEGVPAWMLAADARKIRKLPPQQSVRLLPGFDQYVIAASHHAAHLLPGELRHRIYRPQGWISPVLLVNGLMQGTWRHEVKGSSVEVTIDPFIRLPQWVKRAAAREAGRLAEFLGGTLNLTWNS